MDALNKTENIYISELRSLLKDKFFMLLLGISVAIVMLSTLYSLVRPKTNGGQVASGIQTNIAETSPTITVGSIQGESIVLTPTPYLKGTDGIVGLETSGGDESNLESGTPKTSLFGKIQDKIQGIFGNPSITKTGEILPTEPTSPSVTTPPLPVTPPPSDLKQGRTYTVQEGDTLWTLAEKVYNSGYNFVDIASSNGITNPDYIQVGQKISIPTVQPKQVTVGDITSQAAMTKAETSISATHTVVTGDSLWVIAQKEYNDAYKWTRIAELNPTITNPDFIMPGQVLKLR